MAWFTLFFALFACTWSNTLDSLLENGHPFATVISDAQNTQFQPGPLFLEGGLRQLNPPLLTTERLNLMTGVELFSPWSFKEFQKRKLRIKRYNYYKIAERTPLFKDPTRQILYTGITLEEQKNHQLEALFAQESQEGWVGLFDLKLRNIQHTARDLQIKAFHLAKQREYLLHYKEPWLFLSHWDLEFFGQVKEDSLLQKNQFEISLLRSPTESWRPGIGLGIEYRKNATTRRWHQKTNLLLHSLHENPRFTHRNQSRLEVLKAPHSWIPYFYSKQRSELTPSPMGFAIEINFQDLWQEALEELELYHIPLGGQYGLKAFPTGRFQTLGFLHERIETFWIFSPQFSWGLFGEHALFRQMNKQRTQRVNYGLQITLQNQIQTWKLHIDYALRPSAQALEGILALSINHYF